MVSTTHSLMAIIFVFGVTTKGQSTQRDTSCITKGTCSFSNACAGIQGVNEICTYNGETESCGWTTSRCICNCETKIATPSPTFGSVYESKDYGVFDKVVKTAIDKVKSLACLNEEEMWLTLGLSPAFLDGIMSKTQQQSVYEPVRDFTLQFPQFLDYSGCEADFFIRNYVAKIPGTGVTETITDGGKADKSSTDIVNILQPIYQSIKPQIDGFSASLPDNLKKTAMAVTYTANACLDIKFEVCYQSGYGFAFDFKGGIKYYQTGVQALTLQASDDFSKLPGSVSFDVAYDVLGQIDYAPGNLYSLDVAISSGITGKIASTIISKIENSNHEKVKAAFIGGGYGLSYLVGVDSLSLTELDTAKCIGISFGHSLVDISGGLIPSASFGISRAATVTTEEIKELEDGQNSLTGVINIDKNKCVSEQLWSITLGLMRPDIEI